MHSVLIRNYKYRYNREGIIPGTWYNDFFLDPKSVSLGRSEIAHVDYDIVTVSGRVVLTRDQDGEVHGCGSTGGTPGIHDGRGHADNRCGSRQIYKRIPDESIS